MVVPTLLNHSPISHHCIAVKSYPHLLKWTVLTLIEIHCVSETWVWFKGTSGSRQSFLHSLVAWLITNPTSLFSSCYSVTANTSFASETVKCEKSVQTGRQRYHFYSARIGGKHVLTNCPIVWSWIFFRCYSTTAITTATARAAVFRVCRNEKLWAPVPPQCLQT